MHRDTTVTKAQSHAVQQADSTATSPSVLSKSIPVSLQRGRESIFKERVASIDLRIGLNLLGQEGRKLLMEYISQGSSSE